ncbi:MAG: PD-(D/E)XK nuclease family protein [Cyanothece sp. SIO2G6]|nr:PD-(D/E)XK nuclease family protein [Cyanothece sp. SIO2G6]
MPHTINLLPIQTTRLRRSQGRSYFVDAQGQNLPSVTSILNATKPAEARRALARWKQRVGPETAQQISTSASRRGSQTHKFLQDYLLGRDSVCPDPVLPYWQSLETVMLHISNVRLVEGTVFHYDLGYAGKVDCVASYQGVPCVVDWKTSDRPKETIQRLYDNPLQVAAYCGAVNHTYAPQDVHLTTALIVIAIPDQPAEVFWFDADDLRVYWHQWQERLQQFYGDHG